MMNRDRFELLSAYLDGEVTPEERKIVQHWMDTDPATQRLYRRLMRIRHGIQQVPPPSCDVEETLAGVCQCLRRRVQVASMAGAGVVVLGALGLLSGGLSYRAPVVRQAMDTLPGNGGELQVFLDQAPFPIPQQSATVQSKLDLLPEYLFTPVDGEL